MQEMQNPLTSAARFLLSSLRTDISPSLASICDIGSDELHKPDKCAHAACATLPLFAWPLFSDRALCKMACVRFALQTFRTVRAEIVCF